MTHISIGFKCVRRMDFMRIDVGVGKVRVTNDEYGPPKKEGRVHSRTKVHSRKEKIIII